MSNEMQWRRAAGPYSPLQYVYQSDALGTADPSVDATDESTHSLAHGLLYTSASI